MNKKQKVKKGVVFGRSKVSFDMFELFAMLHGSFVSSLEAVSIYITPVPERDSYTIASLSGGSSTGRELKMEG